MHGHDPADALVGAGTAGFHVARTSQEARDAFEPVFRQRLKVAERFGLPAVFPTLEDFVERSSALVGSPQQIVEKVHRYHESFGHSVMHLSAEASGLQAASYRASLERFQSEIAPVLRREIPDPPWDWDSRTGVPSSSPSADVLPALEGV